MRTKTNAIQFETFDSQKNLTASSIKISRRFLNSLAKEGITTRDYLLKNADKVVETIYKLTPEKNKRKSYLSAIFWALHKDPYLATPNPYHAAFQLVKNIKPEDA